MARDQQPEPIYVDRMDFNAHNYQRPQSKAYMAGPQHPYVPKQDMSFVQHDQRFVQDQSIPVERREYGMPGSLKCAKCNGDLPLQGTYVTANNQCYHHECFTCTSCNCPISGLKYKLVDGRVQCIGCSSPPCDACNHPIEGRQLTAEGRTYHPECFRCNKCDTPLRGEYSINPRNGDRTCMNCDAPSCHSCRRNIGEGESYHCSRDNTIRCVPCARAIAGPGPSRPYDARMQPAPVYGPPPRGHPMKRSQTMGPPVAPRRAMAGYHRQMTQGPPMRRGPPVERARGYPPHPAYGGYAPPSQMYGGYAPPSNYAY